MHEKEIREIIRLFFGKRFSKDTQLRFRYWFRSEEDRDEKEDALQEIWRQVRLIFQSRPGAAVGNADRFQSHGM